MGNKPSVSETFVSQVSFFVFFLVITISFNSLVTGTIISLYVQIKDWRWGLLSKQHLKKSVIIECDD